MRDLRLLGVAGMVAAAPWLVWATAASVGAAAPGAIQAPTVFTDVTQSSGIQVTGLGNASSWADYDGDGDLDLFATNSPFPERSWLYRNDGGGTFTDVSVEAGLKDESIRSVAWADYDNDGHVDLAATTYMSHDRTRLFHNQGDGTFLDVSAQAGMLPASIPWRVSWADYDRDGFVDLYQANGNADFLYRNDGDGTFTEMAQQAGVSDSAFSNDGAWGDFNGDGWPDLFVGDEGADHLYQNDGDGTFTDVTASAGVSDSNESQSACWGDQDSDGRLDLYVVDIDAPSNHLYENDGDGTFTDITASAGVGDVGDGRTCNWVDFDADGRLDLFASNHIHDNRLFRNNGNATFTDVAPRSGIADPFDTFNAAWGDFDGDGALDLFVVGHVDNVLFHNDGPVGGFVHLNLVGTLSNASAIGARVWLVLPGRKVNRVVEGASGAYGQDSLTVEFGVGRAPGPFRARILWPSGTVQTLSVPVNSVTTVIEPAVANSLVNCRVWTVVDSPKVKYGILHAVDASASDDAWAVGDDGGSHTFIDHWDGTTWSLTLQQGATGLNAVAAISPTDVWAGGFSTDLYPEAFLEHWDGAAWTTVSAPTPGAESRVEALAALSTSDVWAAGYWWDIDTNLLHPLYLRWDGSVWTQFDGGVSGGTDIHGLAAIASDDVWAVGAQASDQPFADAPLIQHWDGTSWRSVRPARIPGQGDRQLEGAAAVSSVDVWAMGYGVNSGAAVEHWDGLAWTYLRAPDSGLLDAGSAVGAGDVWAVGVVGSRGISEHWDGSRWRSVPTPNPGGDSPLYGVTAVSSSDVWAVGAHPDQEFGGNYTPMTMHSKGTC